MKFLIMGIICFFSVISQAQSVVNVYIWGGEIPKKVIQQFEQQTHIKVNLSTYDSNETMYAKLKATRQNNYDVIMPSAYFVERMRKQHMLEPLELNQLPNHRFLDKRFLNNEYDAYNQFSMPLIWGATGIFYHQAIIKSSLTAWRQLWASTWQHQLMLLDDSREVFAMALLSLGYNPNDDDPEHIKKAYQHLLTLVPNIKLFASDSVQALMIDEDAMIGSAWNGDAYKAYQENSSIRFVYPEEGYVIWVDCLAMPKNPPHKKAAYQFINFLLTPSVGAAIARTEGHAITNKAGRLLLPEAMQTNPMVYPNTEVLKRGYIQRDVGETTLNLYNQYWQKLKLAF
ncbi:MAG: spermidine/putrescine ABC transporter substrate-binding protein [Legionellaceae bacterium]|nr:spermidine/putrescine ABC transporter substrate-binding protein [Legionellaceae bacterium]HCA89098.1 spermidine/putrescine ABC transporter substrate-binding protein [Legionellales bacterium]|tara:strand:- start:5629 stop:6654 length:1026 start_codon:yes stop_codon:yes gene_type:complete